MREGGSMGFSLILSRSGCGPLGQAFVVPGPFKCISVFADVEKERERERGSIKLSRVGGALKDFAPLRHWVCVPAQ